MISAALAENLVRILGEDRFFLDEDMGKRTSFKTGGVAEAVVTPSSREEIKEVTAAIKASGENLFIMGNGTNLLVRDGGIRGVVMTLYDNYNDVEIQGDTIYAKAGALMSAVANYACRASLSGLEFSAGIPGCVGGAIRMNAGAYGGEIGDHTSRVEILDKDGNIVMRDREAMGFSYRSSKVTPDEIVLSAYFDLEQGDASKIRAKMVDFSKRRKAKQPLNMPSAGSAFKRPEGHYAGQLIEEAGLKGFSIGGAQVSKKHAGFIINTGKATSKDIEDLINHVKKTVFEHSGVMMESEIKIVGEPLS